MKVSTFDILSIADKIESLSKSLESAMKRDANGSITITGAEAQEIADKIFEIAKHLEKKS